MEHHTTTSRAEAERLLGIAEKLLGNKDFAGCRDFAILAQETEPLLEGSDQILAIAEVLHASDTKKLANNRPDHYAVLQIAQRTDDAELIRKKYRRLALLLHPDKNKFPLADSAFRLVADSWAVLSDPEKKSAYDSQIIARFTKVDLNALKKQQRKFNQPMKQNNSQQKLPVRRSSRGQDGGDENDVKSPASPATRGRKKNAEAGSTDSGVNFWTTCPYCYNLYQYQKIYEGCCLRCDNCKRSFTATEILSMPPIVPGKEAYYCIWGFFPMSFTAGNSEGGNTFPKWMPPIFGSVPQAAEAEPLPATNLPPQNVTPVSTAPPVAAPFPQTASASSEKKKRGRPRKNL